MDRRLIIGIGAAVAVTFLALGAYILATSIQHAKTRRALSAAETADQMIRNGNVERAAELLESIKLADLPQYLQSRINKQLKAVGPELRQIDEERSRREAERRQQKQSEAARWEAQERQRRTAEARRAAARRANKDANLQAVGGAGPGFLRCIALAFAGCVFVGIGQLVTAFRDIAINSHIMTDKSPPPYAFIPFLAVVYYVLGAVLLGGAVALTGFILSNF